jgi:L-threonylcarbamoyladenylate synthase
MVGEDRVPRVLPEGEEALEAALEALEAGGVVGVPTDTVYGLAADPSRPGATERVFGLKRRPRGVELPLLVADAAQGFALASEVPKPARRLAERYWPGALTLVLPRGEEVAFDLGEDRRTVGLRCPDHGFVRALCARLGPLAVTSANRHGEPPATVAEAVVGTFGADLALVVDGGVCRRPPSTVVDCSQGWPRCVREGAVAWTEVLALLGGEGPA